MITAVKNSIDFFKLQLLIYAYESYYDQWAVFLIVPFSVSDTVPLIYDYKQTDSTGTLYQLACN